MSFTSWIRTLTASLEERDALKPMYEAKRFAIADLPENTIGRVSGTVEKLDDRELIAPLSKRPCLFWMVHIEGGGYVINQFRDCVPFALVESGRRAIVDPRDANWVLSYSLRDRQTVSSSSAVQLGFLTKANVTTIGHVTQPTFLFREAIVAPGARLAVIGSGVHERDLAHAGEGYRDDAATLLVFGKVTGITDRSSLAGAAYR